MAKKTLIPSASPFSSAREDAAHVPYDLGMPHLFEQQYLNKIINFDMLVEKGTITQCDCGSLRESFCSAGPSDNLLRRLQCRPCASFR